MDKQTILLAALAAGGENTTFSPVQVQKFLFLIDQEKSELVGGPHFNFQPYHYGPFDRAVYEALEGLSNQKLVEKSGTGRYPEYILTQQGYKEGKSQLGQLPEEASSFMMDKAQWVRKFTFQDLIAEIYQLYPDMKQNSVFSQ